MRARIKATGEIAEFSTGKNLQGEIILLKVGTASLFSLSEVEPIADIDWEQIHIQAAVAAMQGMLANPSHQKVQSESGEPFGYFYAMNAIMCANVLVEELKRSDDVYAECRRMDAINTAAICENMTKIQKELQNKDGSST